MKFETEWEPRVYDSDPMVNAVLNVARAIDKQADATNQLLYALKYSKQDGMSIAEAIEVSGKAIAEAVEGLPSGLETARTVFRGP